MLCQIVRLIVAGLNPFSSSSTVLTICLMDHTRPNQPTRLDPRLETMETRVEQASIPVAGSALLRGLLESILILESILCQSKKYFFLFNF